MPNDEEKNQASDNTQSSVNEHKSSAKDRQSETAPPLKAEELNDSGITRTFRRPLNDSKEDSLERKAEDIKSQYERIKLAKKLAVSSITGDFGDLLKARRDDKKAIEEKILDSAEQQCKDTSQNEKRD